MRRTAASLGRRARPRKPLPALLFFTDPTRVARPQEAAAHLPRGAAVVFRAFGAPDSVEQGLTLRTVIRHRHGLLLVGADPKLAAMVGADGVHLPQRSAHLARRIKTARPHWIVTTAAHDLRAARRAAELGADAVVLSAVFASRSPSAGAPIGPIRLARMARRIGAPVYALGGINDSTARLLLYAGLVGLAGVEFAAP